MIKKVAEDRDARLLAESQQRLAEERDQRLRNERCLTIVSKSLAKTAGKLDEELESLGNPVGLPSYFVLGGVVIMVQLFGSVQSEDISDEPKLVVTQYYVSIVGADKRSDTAVEMIRVGTLGWLNYEGLYRALVNAPTYLDFDPNRVRARINV